MVCTTALATVAACAGVPAVAAAPADFVDGIAVVTELATRDEPLAAAIAAATEKNDVTLSPARRIRVAAAGCRRRDLFGGVVAGAEPALAVGVPLDRPDAARRS